MFAAFERELKRYVEGVHRLYPGASDQALRRAEVELGHELPRAYRTFLKRWNGGLLFAKEFFDVHLWPINDQLRGYVREYDSDLVRENRVFLSPQERPSGTLVIGSYSDGSLICLALRPPHRVQVWLRDEHETEEEWESLEAWLDDEMRAGAEMYDIHGNERRSD